MTLRVAGDLRDTLAVFVLRFSRMSETVVVRVTQGDLRGRKIITKSGLQYYSFQGIPYAAPPIGKLRFKVSIFILCKKKKENQFFRNLQPHSYISIVYRVVAMYTNCFNIQKQLHFIHNAFMLFHMTYTTNADFCCKRITD